MREGEEQQGEEKEGEAPKEEREGGGEEWGLVEILEGKLEKKLLSAVKKDDVDQVEKLILAGILF